MIKTLTEDSGAYSAGTRICDDPAEADEATQFVDSGRFATWEDLGLLAGDRPKRRRKKSDEAGEPETKDEGGSEEVTDG